MPMLLIQEPHFWTQEADFSKLLKKCTFILSAQLDSKLLEDRDYLSFLLVSYKDA